MSYRAAPTRCIAPRLHDNIGTSTISIIRSWLRRYAPPPAKRAVGWILIWLRLAGHLPVVIARKGLREVAALCGAYLREGRGLARFAAWCREYLAYERRSDAARYGRWLERHNAALEHPQGRDRHELEVLREQGDATHLREAISACRTEFVLLHPQVARLHPLAAEHLLDHARACGADLVYPDEDAAQDGARAAPFFKPSFSPDLALATDYVGPCLLLRTAAARTALQQIDDIPLTAYALVLAMHAAGAEIARCPKVLVSWPQPRPMALTDAQAAAQAHFRARLDGPNAPADTRVSIIIPTRNRADLLGMCVESIYRAVEGVDVEVIVVNNQSDEADTLAWFEDAASRYAGLRVIDADYAFNWSRLNNQAAALATGGVLMFLNNDIETDERAWIAQLARVAGRADVGAVGPLMHFPNGEIQHAGVVIGIGGFADHVYACVPPLEGDVHQFVSPFLPRNVLACTGACLTMQRAKFDAIGGFNENLRICGDIDICLRLIEAGFNNVYDPRVRLIHHESATRSKAPLPMQEIREMQPVIQPYLDRGDPFYNPNLSLGLRYPSCYG